MEFAWLVRQALERVKPDCIAIELPPTVEERFLQGIDRLPQVSVVAYTTRPSKGEDPREVYLLVEPADPLVEAARLAREREIPLHLVDLDLDDYPLHAEPLPDSYAVHRIGLAAWYDAYRAAGTPPPGVEDLRREQGMAFRLQRLAERHERILFVCGMYHLARIAASFGERQAAPLERVRRENVRLLNLHPDSCGEVQAEYPFLSALYELRRSSLPPLPEQPEGSLRRRFSAFELIQGGKKAIPREEILRQSLERSARQLGSPGEMPDRQKVMLRLFQEAARHYRQETGEPVHVWQKRAFFRYVRNLALVDGMLLPDLFGMLAAGRGCIDDNFAYALHRLAVFCPEQREDAEIPTVRLTAEDLRHGSRSIRFRPREKRPAKGLSAFGFLKRRKEKNAGDWLKGFDNPSICSWPPEDLVIEGYGRFLQKKGARQLSEEQSRVEPFSASLLDGIDLRETIRNAVSGRIYVRENLRVKGGVGSVVVIFDEDRGGNRFPYLMTWLGEHDQESDMAFYATPPADNLVGPGICRCEYGGFILSFPPRRMFDVWQDSDYAFARTKAEVLLLAALDYSRERHVIYAAPRPPRSQFRQLAARLGKKIVHIPLGSLSPVKLKALRVFHILYGNEKREIAKDYIW